MREVMDETESALGSHARASENGRSSYVPTLDHTSYLPWTFFTRRCFHI